MAVAAGLGNIQRIDRRSCIALGKDRMGVPVTTGAGMRACLGMHAAANRRRLVGVAGLAGIGLVHRARELGEIDEQGDLFAGGIGLGQRLVPVAVEAGTVLDRFGGGR